MIKNFLGVLLIVLVYLCLAIVLLAPSLYAVWIYIVSRKVKIKKKRLARMAISVTLLNLLGLYAVYQLTFSYFIPNKMAELDQTVIENVQSAITAQESFFRQKGRFYAVGPIKGPYSDEHGLKLESNIILYIEPEWDRAAGAETFKAYAIHTWKKDIFASGPDKKVTKFDDDGEAGRSIRSKLLNSVK